MSKAPQKILVIAPHPDDETLGCGGALLKHAAAGDEIYWLVMTAMHLEAGYDSQAMARRKDEIEKVKTLYGFKNTALLELSTTRLDTLSLADVIAKMNVFVKDIEPDVLYLPYSQDAHSDHRITFEAGASLAKWFRRKNLKRVFAYETISETEFQFDPSSTTFKPNFYVDISQFVEKKMEIMNVFKSELKDFPFPRSLTAINALTQKRGSECGARAAEAFMLLWSVQ